MTSEEIATLARKIAADNPNIIYGDDMTDADWQRIADFLESDKYQQYLDDWMELAGHRPV